MITDIFIDINVTLSLIYFMQISNLLFIAKCQSYKEIIKDLIFVPGLEGIFRGDNYVKPSLT